MVWYEDHCVGCPPELGCFGASCPNKNVKIYECDSCHEEVSPGELFHWNGYECCIDCIKKELDVVK